MPVEQSSTFQPVKALIIALIAIALAVVAIIFAMQVGRIETVEFKLGDDIFEAGDPDNMAMVIERDGPILWPALVNDRDIWLQHVGPGVDEGWYAFDARQPGTARECTLTWAADDTPLRGTFTDPCDASATFDGIGRGLPSYDVTIDNDLLFIDLNGVADNETDDDA